MPHFHHKRKYLRVHSCIQSIILVIIWIFLHMCANVNKQMYIYIYTPLSLSHLFSLTTNTRHFFWWNVVNHWKTRVLRVPLNYDQRNGITWNYQLMHIIQLRLLYITRTTAKKRHLYCLKCLCCKDATFIVCSIMFQLTQPFIDSRQTNSTFCCLAFTHTHMITHVYVVCYFILLCPILFHFILFCSVLFKMATKLFHSSFTNHQMFYHQYEMVKSIILHIQASCSMVKRSS